MKYTFVIAALVCSASAIKGDGEGVSAGAQDIIDDAVGDVLKIASGKAPFEYPTVSSSSVVHHVVGSPYAVPIPVAHPVAVPYGVPVVVPPVAPSSGAPNSKVIKAVAAANEAKAMKKVK